MIRIRKIIGVLSLLFALDLFLMQTVSFGQCGVPVSSYPYAEDFESGPAGWTSGGSNSDWALGTPSKSVISSAASGTQCWITGGLVTPFYNYGERSWVKSPCFDLSSLIKPVLIVSIFWDTEYLYDGANLQYSTDGGLSWRTLGSYSEPDNCVDQNWYNVNNVTNLGGMTNGTQGWAGTVQNTSGSCRGGHGSGEWKTAKHCLSELNGQTQVIFRFIFGSGTTCNDYDGFAFDQFRIEEATAVPFSYSWSCGSGNTIQFSDTTGCHTHWSWNFNDPGSVSNTSTEQNPQHTFSGPGKYTVTLFSGNDCLPEVSSNTEITILSAAMSSTPETCVNSKDGTASVQVSGSTGVSLYTWDTDPIQNTTTAIGLSSGDYSVLVSTADACDVNATVNVPIGPDAFPLVDLGNDTTLCPGSLFILDAGNFQSYLWQDASTQEKFIVDRGGKYSVKIVNNAGCTTSDSIEIIEDCLNDIIFPNAFTPNQDGKNEEFIPSGSELSNYNLKIFNRWGQLIFETENQFTGWDGKYRGKLQEEGVYVYKAQYSVRQGDIVEKKGKLVLLR